MLLIWAGTVRLLRAMGKTATGISERERFGDRRLTVGMLVWSLWQWQTWNGQDAAFRMFLVEDIILVLLLTPEVEDNERLP
jgi:predicted small integral membrane protein